MTDLDRSRVAIISFLACLGLIDCGFVVAIIKLLDVPGLDRLLVVAIKLRGY